MYLDALFDKDPHLAFDYSDLQVQLYAEFDANKLMDFLRASNYYSLEQVSIHVVGTVSQIVLKSYVTHRHIKYVMLETWFLRWSSCSVEWEIINER